MSNGDAMRADILGLPDHLRDALWKLESARLEPSEAAGVLVCGMGGSAIGGDLATAAYGSRLERPLAVERGYSLPSWVTPDWTVLCSSYSGDTEETLACMAAAGELGARRIVATTGGGLAELARAGDVPVVGLPGILQPRAAVGYMLTVAAAVAGLSGVGPRLTDEIEAAASALEAAREEIAAHAEEIASELAGSIPVVYGGDLTAVLATRWKCQINENAKLPAFRSELPEADHNELAGWPGAGGPGESPFSTVFLVDRDQHPRLRRRMELTAELVGDYASAVVVTETSGDSRTARLLWSVMLGDLVSLELAVASGVDPMPVEAIERFKRELGRP